MLCILLHHVSLVDSRLRANKFVYAETFTPVYIVTVLRVYPLCLLLEL